MKLLVIGGTAGIGRRVVDAALARQHDVRAMGRSADALPKDVRGLEPFVGDALDGDDVRRALAGVDAVVQALGIKESVSMLWREVTLFSSATTTLLEAMNETGVSLWIGMMPGPLWHTENQSLVTPISVGTPRRFTRACMPGAGPALWLRPSEVAAAISFLIGPGVSGATGAAPPVTGRA